MTNKLFELNNSIRFFSLRCVFVLLMFIIQSIGCASVHCYKEQTGTVLDKETNQPIAGAAVVSVYYVEQSSVGGAVQTYVDAQETKTDESGSFVLPQKCVSAFRVTPLKFVLEPELFIYYPGYGQYGTSRWATESVDGEGNIEYRLPTTIGKRARLRNIGGIGADIQNSKIKYYISLTEIEMRSLGYGPGEGGLK